jgi:methionyl-tRNA synthetase
VQEHGPDAVRYYFSKGLDFGGDGDFSQKRFTEVIYSRIVFIPQSV